MRTMKRVAAVAMSIVVLMTSGVTAKAAVTDAQPAKSNSEAYLKWANQISTGWDTLSEIKIVGNYIYAADDSQHRIIKIDKKTGDIVKEHEYNNKSYKQYYVGNIGYGDGKVYVAYENGKIEAFDENSLEPLWISESANYEVASKFFYDGNGHLYFGSGAGVPESRSWDKGGKYYVLDTKDEDENKTDEEKSIKEVTTASDDANYYLKQGIKAGKYIIISDNRGKITSIDSENNVVIDTKEIKEIFSGGIAYDKTTNSIYFVAGTNKFYGIKLNENGTFGEEKNISICENGYSAMTPEVYNGRVYVSGTINDTNDPSNKGYFATIDVSTDEYKVAYMVKLPAYSQSEMLVSKTDENSVKVYFAMNTDKAPGVYCISDTKDAKSGELETVYEPTETKYINYCMSSIWSDEEGTLYYTNDSRSIFAIGKKSTEPSEPTKPTETTTATKPSATTTVVKPTTPAKKKITKTQTSTRTVKLTWKKNKSAKGYVIYVKAGKASYKKLKTVGKTTKKTVKVKAGTTYKFKVKPYKYTTKKGKKVKKYYKTYAAKIKSQSKTEKVVYKNVTGYTSYRIDMKVGNGSYKSVWTSKKKSTSTVTTLTYTYTNAKIGKSYKFRLVGIKKVNGKNTYKTLK